MNIFCRTITPQRVNDWAKLAPQLKNFYLGEQPYLTSTWRAREEDLIFGAGCDLIVRAQAAASELPAHALHFGAPESKENWATALVKNNVLILWTKGVGLPNAIAAALRSPVATTEGVRAKRGTTFQMVWPQTRMALLKALENGFTLPEWNTYLIPAIQSAEMLLPELDTNQTERFALREAYQRTLLALRARQAQNTAGFLSQLPNIAPGAIGVLPASDLPQWDAVTGQVKKAGVDLQSVLFLGGAFAAVAGIVVYAKKLRLKA